MPNHRQQLGDRDVVASGTFVLGQGEGEATVHIDNLKLIFSFVELANEPPRVEPIQVNSSTLKFQLTGWSNNLTTTYGAENIATLNGRSLNVRIAVVTVGELKFGGLLTVAPPRVLNYLISAAGPVQ